MRVLVTGCCGFAGSHICNSLVTSGHHVVGLDKLTYAAKLEWFSGHQFIHHDLAESINAEKIREIGPVDVVVHNAAESHVNNALYNPELVVRSNALGTLNVLEAARHWNGLDGKRTLARFIYVSTDEVFGPSPVPMESKHVLWPTNPYAATKAAGEHLVNAYRRSFGLPTLVTRTCNMFGPRQHVEKFVPLVIRQLTEGETVTIHTTQGGSVGSRSWCHVGDQARALTYLSEHGVVGETYHVAKGKELSNLEMAELIACIMRQKLHCKLQVSDRPFYDECYRIQESSGHWRSGESIVELLRDTVKWYLREWQKPYCVEEACA